MLKSKIAFALTMLLLLLSNTACARVNEPEQKKEQKPESIYASKLSADDQITAALKRATERHQRVLLDFGADWCPWCRALHGLMTKNDAQGKTLIARPACAFPLMAKYSGNGDPNSAASYACVGPGQ